MKHVKAISTAALGLLFSFSAALISTSRAQDGATLTMGFGSFGGTTTSGATLSSGIDSTDSGTVTLRSGPTTAGPVLTGMASPVILTGGILTYAPITTTVGTLTLNPISEPVTNTGTFTLSPFAFGGSGALTLIGTSTTYINPTTLGSVSGTTFGGTLTFGLGTTVDGTITLGSGDTTTVLDDGLIIPGSDSISTPSTGVTDLAIIGNPIALPNTPEPSATALLAGGLALLGRRRRKR